MHLYRSTAYIARQNAEKLGIKDVYADCLPEMKKERMATLKGRYTCVAMVGDGINDALSMEACDLGIALSSTTSHELTKQQAHVVIRGTSLQSILTMMEISKQASSNIKQNLLFNLSYNVLAMSLASGVFLSLGWLLNPGVGAGLMMLQSLCTTLNLWRFERQTLPPFEALDNLGNQSPLPIIPQVISSLPCVTIPNMPLPCNRQTNSIGSGDSQQFGYF